MNRVGGSDLFVASDSSWPPRDGCSVDALIDGPVFFSTLKSHLLSGSVGELAVALSFCSPQFSLGGHFGDSWLDFVQGCVSLGIRVNILAWNNMVNPIFSGTFEPSDSNLQTLRQMQHGHLISIRWTDSAPDMHHCHHEKSWILDQGRLSFTGGIIPSPNWTRPHDQGGHMHDVNVSIAGDASYDLYEAFVERWNAARGPSFPPAGTQDLVFSRPATLEPAGSARVQVTRSIRPGLISPQGEASVLSLWKSAIQGARELIYVEQQHLAHEETLLLLIAALQRGVKVIYVRPGLLDATDPEYCPSNLDQYLSRTKPEYERVFLRHVREFGEKGGVLCGLYNSKQNARLHVHSKLLIVDDLFYAVGSANLVDISFDLGPELHTEVCVGVLDAPGARKLRQQLFSEHLDKENHDGSWAEFVQIAERNAKMLASGKSRQMEGQVFTMNAAAWGKAILPFAVDIYERARGIFLQ